MRQKIITLLVPSAPIGRNGLPVNFNLLFTPKFVYTYAKNE